MTTPLNAISPIDGRYANKTALLIPFFSETALMKYRLLIEIRWLQHLERELALSALKPEHHLFLENIVNTFSDHDAAHIKHIEETTRHDLKAVEYFLQEKIDTHVELKKIKSFIHFACTSEDINNLAYALMIKESREKVLSPQMNALIHDIRKLAHQYADIPMLARTHGQAATPTTLGKEMAIFVARLEKQIELFSSINIQGKCNGATGNYNAHMIAYPEHDWENISSRFVASLDLRFTAYTTQIESHDFIAELMHANMRFNNILLDFSRDIWSYISTGYFQQKIVKHEVGSSTMPHKINPIDFENAEGNLGLANSLMEHFANKLPISRLQRDLSDSTVLRNIGVAFSYNLIAYQSLKLGISKLEVNTQKLQEDLENQWPILSEAIQTVMRRYGIEDAYEQLKELSRGKLLTQHQLISFIDQSNLPLEAKARLKQLTPASYIGLASRLSKSV
jgi:adenylosuccinate lyase